MYIDRRSTLAALSLAPVAAGASASKAANAGSSPTGSEPMGRAAPPARLTPQNASLVMVDFMSKLIDGVKSHPRDVVINNATAFAKIGPTFALPTFILGDEGERLGTFDPTIHAPVRAATRVPRHTVSAWREPGFVRAIEATGRPNLIIAGISTDMCVALLAMDALAAGKGVYLVCDASSSQSSEMHRAGIDRMVQAGVVPMTWVSTTGELLSDWQSKYAAGAQKLFADHLGMS